ncbi:MAG: hypothetical protein RIR00_365 [Pseudomonadota bacterium]|jgi:hemerythrin-like domain-containing protein
MTDPLRHYLSDDHRRCDDLFAAAEQAFQRQDAASAQASYARFQEAMLAHFAAEESLLFPEFEARTGIRMGPTQVMRLEHIQMRSLMEEARQALIDQAADDFSGSAETLLIMMQQHNMKEENVLYPMCDQHLADSASDLLTRLREAIAA